MKTPMFAVYCAIVIIVTSGVGAAGQDGYDPLTTGKTFFVNPNGTMYFMYSGSNREKYFVSAGEWAKISQKPTLYIGDGAFSDCIRTRCTDINNDKPRGARYGID